MCPATENFTSSFSISAVLYSSISPTVEQILKIKTIH